MLDEWREKRPPHQLILPKGAAIIRDMRTWHAGMPNRPPKHRGMLGNIHVHRKFKPIAIRVERGSEGFFKHPVLTTNLEVVDSPIQYLPKKNGPVSTDLTLENVQKAILPDQEKIFEEIRQELLGSPTVVELKGIINDLGCQGRIKRSGHGLASRWRKHIRYGCYQPNKVRWQ